MNTITTPQDAMDVTKGYRVPVEEHTKALGRTAGIVDPTYNELVSAMVKYGPVGILEAACHLAADEFAKLANLVSTWRPAKARS